MPWVKKVHPVVIDVRPGVKKFDSGDIEIHSEAIRSPSFYFPFAVFYGFGPGFADYKKYVPD